MKHQIACIEWIDASINMENDTKTYEKACQENLVHGFAVGILITEDKHRITIARDWFDGEDAYRGISTYPKTGIKKITKYDAFGKINTDHPTKSYSPSGSTQ